MTSPPTKTLRATVEGDAYDVRVGASEVLVTSGNDVEPSALTIQEAGTSWPRTLRLRSASANDAPQAERATRAQVAIVDDRAWVFVEGEAFEVELDEAQQQAARRRERSTQDALAAPMPATVTKIFVESGQLVARGDTLLLLEAMKMEMPIKAPHDGTVTRVRCRPGELVQPGEPLLDLEPSDPRRSS